MSLHVAGAAGGMGYMPGFAAAPSGPSSQPNSSAQQSQPQPTQAKPAGAAAAVSQLTPEQQALATQLAVTDQHVRAHEQAHLAAAGQYARSGPTYGYTTGPDGRQYATSGEVALDVSPDPSDPRKTVEKARVVQAAANAPADPSSQDRAVAAAAAQMEQRALQEVAALRLYESSGPASGQVLNLLA